MDQTAVDAITAGVNFGTVIVGIGTIAGTVATLVVTMRGAKELIRAIRG